MCIAAGFATLCKANMVPSLMLGPVTVISSSSSACSVEKPRDLCPSQHRHQTMPS